MIKKLEEIRARVTKARQEAQKAYVEACKQYNRPGKESWVKHYESRPALERDMDYLFTEVEKATKAAPLGIPSPYLVHCEKDEEFGSCGASSYLTRQQYDKQMASPNRGWACPQCGCYPCRFDDENFEKQGR